MQAKELVKWNEISVVLRGNPNTIRADRINKKDAAKIEALLDYVQNWIDRKGNVKEARVTIKVPEVEEQNTYEGFVNKHEMHDEVPNIPSKVLKEMWDNAKPKKLDYKSVKALPLDRKIVIDPDCRGIYSSGNKFYTNKVKDGALDIREWSKIQKAKEYLNSLK
jgi:hypothetical protein